MLVKPLFFSKHVRLVKVVKALYFRKLHAAHYLRIHTYSSS